MRFSLFCLFFSYPVYIEKSALRYLANLCDGDARSALNTFQVVVQSQAPSQQASNNSDQSQASGPSQSTNGLELGTDVNHEESEIVVITTCHVKEALQRTHVMYDREGSQMSFTEILIISNQQNG